MKTDEQIRKEAEQDWRELQAGRARYSTRGEELMILTVAIAFALGVIGFLWLVIKIVWALGKFFPFA